MTLKLRHFYEFGPFRLEPDEQLLVSGDQPVPIAPKYFELLVFLVQNCGRLVTKDQIMQTVWSGSFVEEANLTVAISAIRKALGEKEGNLRYIETVPKRGYRFIAQVREVEESPTTTLIPQADSSSPNLEEFSVKKNEDRSAAAQRLSEPGLVDPDLVDPDLINSASTPSALGFDGPVAAATRDIDRQRWILKITLALVGIAALVAYAIHLKQMGRRPFSGEPRSLAILPLQNLKSDVDSDFLGFSLADALITKLDYVSSLTVRPSAAVEKYRNQVIDIQKVAADLKADTLLTGSFIRDGENLRITYQLIDVKTEKILGRGTVDLKYDNLLKVQDSVSAEIIRNLQLNLSPSEAERINSDVPISPLAYEYYLRGVDLHGQHNFPMSIKMLEKSTEIDPNYAPAWAYLGASYTSDAAFEFGGREQYRRSQDAYERALAIQPSQLDAQIFLANQLVDTGKVEQAIPLLRNALKTNPNYAAAHWELGYAYRFAGMLSESVAECERARQLDPLVKANGSALNAYLYLGQYEKFLDSLPDANDSLLLFYRGFGKYYENDWEGASKDFDRAYEVGPTLYTQIGSAFSKSIAHQENDGLEILRGLEIKIRERGVGDPEALYKIAQAYVALGDKASALRLLQRSIESGFFCYPYVAADPLLKAIRDAPEFGHILEEARQRHEKFKSIFF